MLTNHVNGQRVTNLGRVEQIAQDVFDEVRDCSVLEDGKVAG